MNNYITTGRYLCQEYFRGNLKPSTFYCREVQGLNKACTQHRRGEARLAECVEGAIEAATPHLSYVWAALLAGDLRRLNTSARTRLLGGGAPEWGFESIDGAEEVTRVSELCLYYEVGHRFARLCATCTCTRARVSESTHL